MTVGYRDDGFVQMVGAVGPRLRGDDGGVSELTASSRRSGPWVPAFAGMTVGVVGAMVDGEGWRVIGVSPACRIGRTRMG